MKNDALCSGALVTPSSCTLGTFAGIGVGSLYARADSSGSWYVLIVASGLSLETDADAGPGANFEEGFEEPRL